MLSDAQKAITEGVCSAVHVGFLDVWLKEDVSIRNPSQSAEAWGFATKHDPLYCNYSVFS